MFHNNLCIFVFSEPSFFTLAVVLLVLFTVLIGFVVFLIIYSKRYTSSQHNDENPLEDSETEDPETDTECKENQENEKILSVL